jgi:hypothetical protein
MLPERLAGAIFFVAGVTIFITRASRRWAQHRHPAFAYDALAVVTIIALILGVILLTGLPVLNFSN